jgi:hypothetical protein
MSDDDVERGLPWRPRDLGDGPPRSMLERAYRLFGSRVFWVAVWASFGVAVLVGLALGRF